MQKYKIHQNKFNFLERIILNKFFQFSEYIKLGKIFNQCTAYLISIEYLDKAIELSSYLPLNKYRLIKAYDLRGNSNMFLGNYQEAIVDFSKALEIDSRDSYLYFWRGFAYESLMDYPNAVKDLKISQHLDPEFELTKILLDNIKRKGY